MLRVAVCDDDKEILTELSVYLEEFRIRTKEGIKYRCFQKGKELLEEMQKGGLFHIVFLDIELEGENGIELAGEIRERYPGTLLIFITGHDRYVYECFRVQPLDFLRKPLNRNALETAFDRAIEQCDMMPVWEYTFRDTFSRVKLEEICYFMSDRRKVVIRTRTGEQEYYDRLNHVEEELMQRSTNFVRVSNYLIVNIRYVSRVQYRVVELTCGSESWEFNISQAYRERVRKFCLDRWRR